MRLQYHDSPVSRQGANVSRAPRRTVLVSAEGKQPTDAAAATPLRPPRLRVNNPLLLRVLASSRESPTRSMAIRRSETAAPPTPRSPATIARLSYTPPIRYDGSMSNRRFAAPVPAGTGPVGDFDTYVPSTSSTSAAPRAPERRFAATPPRPRRALPKARISPMARRSGEQVFGGGRRDRLADRALFAFSASHSSRCTPARWMPRPAWGRRGVFSQDQRTQPLGRKQNNSRTL